MHPTHNPLKGLRWMISLCVLALVSLFFGRCAEAQSFSDAIGFLAKEQSVAESYAGILKEFGKENLQNYAEGIGLYANAKGEYDGFIDQMIFDLKSGKPFDASPEFQNKLKNAADKRAAFTSFVEEKVIRGDKSRKNPLVIAAIGAAPELISAISKAATSIWQEYRSVSDAKKTAILDHLERLKWKSFQDAGSKN